MQKIFFTKDGWVCNRYPYNLEIESEDQVIEVSDEVYQQTLCCSKHYSWRVVNGELVEDRYEDTPEEEILTNLRSERSRKCFPIINRGKLWYNHLTKTQLQELDSWYKAWLDVTETRTPPETPEWLN